MSGEALTKASRGKAQFASKSGVGETVPKVSF